MRITFLFAILRLFCVYALEGTSNQQTSLGIVVVEDTNSNYADDYDDVKQSKRSLHEIGAAGVAYAEVGFHPQDHALFDPGLAGAPLAVAAAPVAAIAQPVGPPSGLYTEAIAAADPLPLGSGYAPAFAGIAGPIGPIGEQLVHQHVEITRPVPVPVYRTVAVAVPQPVAVAVPQPVAVQIPQPVPYEVPVPVVKTIPYPVEKPVPYPVEKPYPVKIVKKVPVPVPKPYPVHVPIYKVKHIYHHEPKW